MSPPTDISEIRQFIGMVNQLAYFLRNFADITNLLCELLSKRNLFHWGTAQQKTF